MNVTLHSSPYRKRPLGEVADVISGFAFKSTDFGDKGIPVIKIKNIRLGHVDLNEASYVDEKHLSIPDRFHVKSGDVLISLTGSHITQPNSVVGRIARHSNGQPRCLLNQRAGKIIAKDKRVCDPRFLFYALSEQETMLAIAVKAHGAASQANVSPSQVESIEISFPPLPVQQRIAGILSAYDELIENSQRRIKILETMAHGLYREWFVHFRFPGHENHPRVASALGEIPGGWAIQKVGDLVEFKKGKKPTAVFESAESGLKRHLLIDALRGGSSLEFVMPDKLISTTVDDTIMVMDGSGSSDVFIGYEGVIGSTLGRYRVVDVSDGGPFWLFLFLDTHLEEIKSKNIGSAIPHANKDFINGMSVAVAPKSVLLNFERAVTPMFGLIRSLRSKTDALRRTRDLLLPRLLSGQIEVGGT
jgi:type I restriction enzyme S subunit